MSKRWTILGGFSGYRGDTTHNDGSVYSFYDIYADVTENSTTYDLTIHFRWYIGGLYGGDRTKRLNRSTYEWDFVVEFGIDYTNEKQTWTLLTGDDRREYFEDGNYTSWTINASLNKQPHLIDNMEYFSSLCRGGEGTTGLRKGIRN